MACGCGTYSVTTTHPCNITAEVCYDHYIDIVPFGTATSIIQQPVNGTATILPNGKIRYQHNGENYNGDPFQYAFDYGNGSGRCIIGIKVLAGAPQNTTVITLTADGTCDVGTPTFEWLIPECATLHPDSDINDQTVQVIVPNYDPENPTACCEIRVNVCCDYCNNCCKCDKYLWCPPQCSNECGEEPDCNCTGDCQLYNPETGNCDGCPTSHICCEEEGGQVCKECCSTEDCPTNQECLAGTCGCPPGYIELPSGYCCPLLEETACIYCNSVGEVINNVPTCPPGQVADAETCTCVCEVGLCLEDDECVSCPPCVPGITPTSIMTNNGFAPYLGECPVCSTCVICEGEECEHTYICTETDCSLITFSCNGMVIPGVRNANPYDNYDNLCTQTTTVCSPSSPCCCKPDYITAIKYYCSQGECFTAYGNCPFGQTCYDTEMECNSTCGELPCNPSIFLDYRCNPDRAVISYYNVPIDGECVLALRYRISSMSPWILLASYDLTTASGSITNTAVDAFIAGWELQAILSCRDCPSVTSTATVLDCEQVVFSYNCVSNTCLEVEGNGGQYADILDCQDVCGNSSLCPEFFLSIDCVEDSGVVSVSYQNAEDCVITLTSPEHEEFLVEVTLTADSGTVTEPLVGFVSGDTVILTKDCPNNGCIEIEVIQQVEFEGCGEPGDECFESSQELDCELVWTITVNSTQSTTVNLYKKEEPSQTVWELIETVVIAPGESILTLDVSELPSGTQLYYFIDGGLNCEDVTGSTVLVPVCTDGPPISEGNCTWSLDAECALVPGLAQATYTITVVGNVMLQAPFTVYSSPCSPPTQTITIFDFAGEQTFTDTIDCTGTPITIYVTDRNDCTRVITLSECTGEIMNLCDFVEGSGSIDGGTPEGPQDRHYYLPNIPNGNTTDLE
ncbi:MAG TPA: hypothetical protein PKD00_00405 [Burkholderiales bacterium]|nr:hypothetical protein [Burkholderiales bacterium]